VTSAGSWRNWIASWRTGLAFERCCCGFGLSPCVDVPDEVVAVLDEELAQLGVVDEPAWVGDLVPSRENGADKREPARLAAHVTPPR
jgi:hypothetical protein